MPEPQPNLPAPLYRAYLLRMWCAAQDNCAWQASLQDSKTGVRIGFASLEGLFAYLMQTTEAQTPNSVEKRSP